MVVVQRKANLLEVVKTLDAVGGFSDLLHGRDQEPNQDGDDGNHHEQLNQGETLPAAGTQPRSNLEHDTNLREGENGEK
jgi:hypothetical protein